MRVWIVLEDDRGLGPMIRVVFASLEAAKAYLKGRSHCYLASEEGEVVES